jgi:hypothetical protein
VHRQDEWNALVSKWTGAVAVGGGRKLRVFVTRPNEPFVPLFAVEIPDVRVFGSDVPSRYLND